MLVVNPEEMGAFMNLVSDNKTVAVVIMVALVLTSVILFGYAIRSYKRGYIRSNFYMSLLGATGFFGIFLGLLLGYGTVSQATINDEMQDTYGVTYVYATNSSGEILRSDRRISTGDIEDHIFRVRQDGEYVDLVIKQSVGGFYLAYNALTGEVITACDDGDECDILDKDGVCTDNNDCDILDKDEVCTDDNGCDRLDTDEENSEQSLSI